MMMNSAIRDMAFRSEPAQNIRRQARLFGMKSLYEDALDKAVLGVTTIPEAMHLFTGH